MKTTATRRFQFCMGHRVYNHESKCRNLHGHNYVVLITAEGIDSELDPLGRVIDFSEMKEMAKWCEANWDHGFLLYKEDSEAIKAVSSMPSQKMAFLDVNPTAENIASFLLKEVGPALFSKKGIRITKVVVWETENCFAEVAL